jgi:hypothetical protein
MRRKNQSWSGMTRWFLWSAAAKHGIVEILDPAMARWGDLRGVAIKRGHKRTLDVAWHRIFAESRWTCGRRRPSKVGLRLPNSVQEV